MDSYRIFEATEDEDALVWVRKRGVELIIVDREARGSLYRRDSRGRGRQQAILYQRLQRGRIADWLDRVRLPKEIRSRFGVFSVKALP